MRAAGLESANYKSQITNYKLPIELAMSFAAIYVPDFPVEAMVRAEPELREQAVAVVEGTPPLVHVVAVNERAAQAGVEPGMTRLQAESMVDGRWPMAGSELRVASRDENRQSIGSQKAGEGKRFAGEGAREGSDSRYWKSSPGEAPGPTKSKVKLSQQHGPTRGGVLRQRSAEREAAAHAALLDCACGFSPRVEDTAADTVVLDLAGLERIFGPPAKMARDVARRCSEMGLEANVAVASNADTAALAARGLAGVTVIAEGKEAERLGELSVEVLTGSMVDGRWSMASSASEIARGRENQKSEIENQQCVEILETLERWGVRNLRALAALPEVALAERLGQEGLRLQKLARGENRRPLVVAEPPLVFEEAAELEYPVDVLEPLAFLLNRMLEQLCARLAARALATNELKLRLELDLAAEIENPPRRHGDTEEVDGRRSMVDGNTDVGANHKSQSTDHNSSVSSCLRGEGRFFTRTLRLPVPMLDAKVFLKLLQLDLQAHPPQAPVTKVWLRAEPAEPRRTQNGLFVPEAPEAERLELTIARIKKVVGTSRQAAVASRQENQESTIENRQCSSEARVGSPEMVDTHRADAFRMKPFTASGQWPVASGQENRQSTIGNRKWGDDTLESERTPTASPLTALRVFRPALAAVVTMREGKPAQVASAERPTMRGEVVWCAGPWRSSGEWWAERAWWREEWDVAVRNEEGVALYRVYRDEIEGKWWVEGSYD
jgi:protein ImuB